MDLLSIRNYIWKYECVPLVWHCRIEVVILWQAFSGTQNVSSLQKEEAWRVNVRIQGCDLEHGYLCGTMEALNVPMADTPVRSFCFSSVGHLSPCEDWH